MVHERGGVYRPEDHKVRCDLCGLVCHFHDIYCANKVSTASATAGALARAKLVCCGQDEHHLILSGAKIEYILHTTDIGMQ